MLATAEAVFERNQTYPNERTVLKAQEEKIVVLIGYIYSELDLYLIIKPQHQNKRNSIW